MTTDLCTLDDVKDWLQVSDRTITAISKADPGVVTIQTHNFRNGMRLYLSNIVGMTELNGQTVRVTVLTKDTFSIGVDTRAFGNFVSGFVGSDDVTISKLITRATQDIVNEANRDFDQQDYSEVRSGVGWGQSILMAKQTPITAVKSLTIDGRDIPASDGESAGYIFVADHISLVGFEFTKGLDNIAVTYTAGYATPPPDLNGACAELVGFRYKSRDRIGEKTKGLAGQSTTYDTSHLPDAVERVVQRYKRVIPI